jgi:hypothetical protein
MYYIRYALFNMTNTQLSHDCIALTDYDHAGTHLEPAHALFDDLGLTLPGLNFRDSFAFVAVKGSKVETVRDVKPRGQGPARVHTAYINPELVSDLTT